ncbi:DUF1499 domain-containing protein [Pseudochelatococcus sp. B33]
MRRLVIEEPVSRAAIWGRRVALFSVPVFAGGILLTRQGGDDLTSGLAVIWAAALLAVVALALGVAALAQIWREGRRGLEGAIQTLLISAAVLVLPGFFAVRLLATPYYADLTTDTVNPPAFSRSSAALAARGGLAPPAVPAGAIVEELADLMRQLARDLPLPASDPARLRDMQRRARPEFRPLRTDLPPEEAFSRALKTAEAEGWAIVDRIPPGGLFGIGHLDAVQYTSLLRLPVDVTVRLRIHAEGTTVDVRSVPRYRLFDIGTGPRRIERFLESIAPAEG